jgi:ATP-dependent DNA helicase RecG
MRYRVTDTVAVIEGVGPVVRAWLEDAGIHTVGDLLFSRPRRYIDGTELRQITSCVPGENVTIRGSIHKVSMRYIVGRKSIVIAQVKDETGTLSVQWFNQPYIAQSLSEGMTVILIGKIRDYKGKNRLDSPIILRAEGVLARYALVPGVKPGQLSKFITHVLPRVEVPEILPESARTLLKIGSMQSILTSLHEPKNVHEAQSAQEQMSIVEAFCFFASLQPSVELERQRGLVIADDLKYRERLRASLPFTLTHDQAKVVDEIVTRLGEGTVMTRLLNGDVGSGKTAVAALVAASVVRGGHRVAVLAPTEVLANQHFATFSNLLKQSGATVALLTGSRKDSTAAQADILIGTHALLHAPAILGSLGLVVIDEQHRFGVRQRAWFSALGHEAPPHILAMTATPIPRSLALTLYVGLEISFLKQRPQERYVIHTHHVTTRADKQAVHEAIVAAVTRGEQVYVVCPAIEPPDEDSVEMLTARQSVLLEYERLQEKYATYRVGLLHGRLKPKEKQAVLEKFMAGMFDILVSTTVIEVGVDVPNATVMVIEDADRYGLAQLHQLRGRVGRGSQPGTCFLIPSKPRAAAARLAQFVTLEDGFAVAELDLATRGPGELTGVVQAGMPTFQYLELNNIELLASVRMVYEEVIKDIPDYTVPVGVPFASSFYLQ